jgi:hypothetical protein
MKELGRNEKRLICHFDYIITGLDNSFYYNRNWRLIRYPYTNGLTGAPGAIRTSKAMGDARPVKFGYFTGKEYSHILSAYPHETIQWRDSMRWFV